MSSMILSAPHILRALRWVPPAIVLLGTPPTYVTAWTAIRTLTLPFPDWVYHYLEETLYSSYEAFVGMMYEHWSGVEFRFYGDKLPNNPENVLYMSNHQCSVDWIIAEVLCVKQGGYGGRTRYVLKDVLKFVPMYGWVLGERGGIYIKRHKSRDQEKLIRGLNAFVEKKRKTWLVVFPEGTRYDLKKRNTIERSQEFSRNLGLPELQHVLMPKTTGFEMAVGHIRDHFKAVYDVTIFYEGFTYGKPVRAPPPNLFGFFCGQCARVHVHIRRIPIEDIPQTPEGQREWLYDAYLKKDRMIDEIIRQGSFSSPRVDHPLLVRHWGLPALFFTAVLIGALSTRYGRLWWVGTVGLYSIIGLIRVATVSWS